MFCDTYILFISYLMLRINVLGYLQASQRDSLFCIVSWLVFWSRAWYLQPLLPQGAPYCTFLLISVNINNLPFSSLISFLSVLCFSGFYTSVLGIFFPVLLFLYIFHRTMDFVLLILSTWLCLCCDTWSQ